MQRQVIQNVIDLPGISGMALIEGRNRPCFMGPGISLNAQQQDALGQGIQQVVETTPTDCETLIFSFANQLIHIYKLGQDLILLVLLTDQMPLTEYRAAIGQLKATLIESPHNAMSTFRWLAECATLDSGAVSHEPEVGDAVGGSSGLDQGTLTPDYQSVVNALNHLSDGATQYLGKTIVVNTWKQSRPAHPWLEQFELQKDGHFTVEVDNQTLLTAEQHQWIKDWVSAFLGRGGRTIRNFQMLAGSQTLTPEESKLLLETQSSA
ncbi:hypothetical protein IQ254_12255 [Nodosilinea sp. LEGE 07088]|nr:hypothetical protein [Nodosilinea sp. LEGE 07088]